MTGATILLLLACGGILVQGSHGNANTNSNRNHLSRRNSNTNFNTNTNTNFLGGDPLPSRSRYGEIEKMPGDEPRVASENVLEQVRHKLHDENDPLVASVAAAAAEGALMVTKTLTQELSQAIAIEVAESVARIIRRPSSYRRNYNSNTNTNIIGQGFNSARDPQYDQESQDFGQDSVGKQISYPSRFWRTYNDHDEDEVNEEVEEEILLPDVKDEDEEEVKEALAERALSRRGYASRRRSSPFGYQGKYINQMKFRRNSNGMNRPRNTNSNANYNKFRRNINSNSNNNMFRRNINSNSNNNRINRGSRYRLD